MFSPLVPSALDASTQAFPVFSISQIDRIRSCSRSRQVAAGDILFEPGDENVPFYVVLSGRMEIVQPDLAGEHLIAKHGPREFTGEMTMISGRRCLARPRNGTRRIPGTDGRRLACACGQRRRVE
jgi:thioredoxin reductase (NADPH)